MAGSGEGVRAAVVQAAPVAFDLDATLAKAERLTGECAAGGAQLVVFPEAFVSCYPRGLTFGAPIGSRSPEGRAWFRRYWDSSIDVPGPAVDRLSQMAAEHGVYLVIGVIERDVGTLHCTALFFSSTGAYLGKHRKLMPTAAERLVWGVGDGSTLPVFDTPLGRLGAVVLAGRTTCRFSGPRCTRKGSSCGARRLPMPGTRGWPRRSTSLARVGVSCCRPTSSRAVAITPRITRSRAITNRTRSCAGAPP